MILKNHKYLIGWRQGERFAVAVYKGLRRVWQLISGGSDQWFRSDPWTRSEGW
jgi:hypothetical protein